MLERGAEQRGGGTGGSEVKPLARELEDSKVIELVGLLSLQLIYMWTTYKSGRSSNQPTRLINTEVITVKTLPYKRNLQVRIVPVTLNTPPQCELA